MIAIDCNDTYWQLNLDKDGVGYPGYNGYIDNNNWSMAINDVLPAGSYIANFYNSGWTWQNLLDTESFIIKKASKHVDILDISYTNWVRIKSMTCYQVWINEANNLEFIFWWEHYNNNWVKIYDMEGNEVFSIDTEKGNAHFEAALHDGMYTL